MSAAMDVTGRICGLDSMTMLDGIGKRAIVFLHGCPLRCLFCANPEAAWAKPSADSTSVVTVGSIITRLARLKEYGLNGLTVSGGEPLMQPAFTSALMKCAKEQLTMTTALDTSGCGSPAAVEQVLQHTDHALFCIKSAVPATYAALTGHPIERSLAFARQLALHGTPWYLRYVLLPGITNTPREVDAMVSFARRQPTLQAVELLPYHELGLHKWHALGLHYDDILRDLAPPSKDEVAKVVAAIKEAGLQCIV
jgi:pyruvate formate lyase activating enzyme